MMNDTEDMRQARHELQILSVSDPASSANMLRYVAAVSLMVAGRRGRARHPAEPEIAAGFKLTHGDHHLFATATRNSGIDTVYLAFDVDDAAGPLLATGVFRKQDADVELYGNCRLWSPANEGRALLVPAGEGDYLGYLAFRPERPLRLVAAPVPGDLDAGFRRAETRLRRLLASDALRDVHRGGYVHRIRNEGQVLFAETMRAAA